MGSTSGAIAAATTILGTIRTLLKLGDSNPTKKGKKGFGIGIAHSDISRACGQRGRTSRLEDVTQRASSPLDWGK
eukprot:2274292-Karenia_brevis.AAC.1